MALKTNEVVVLATARAIPGKEADLERALREAATPTQIQTGCLQFELYRSANDPAVITVIERWEPEDAHQLHLQDDHVNRLMTRFNGILAGPPESYPWSRFE